MPTYTIELSDVEQKAMEYISTDVNFWIQNAVHERARLAIEELVNDDIQEALATGRTVHATSKEFVVLKSKRPNAVARNEIAMKQMMTPPGTGEPS